MTIAFLQPNIAMDLIQICLKNNFKAIFIALKIYYFILLNFLTRSSKSCIELIALGLI